ncbi:SPFH domain-containing protein [Paenibacillus validus]|uniref:SPFH domain-containing protein n=1 Tax=Paenibacillus validus TaxID=44253 RepID=A0A7X3CTJ4_9BACL|nr:MULTISPECIES: SPFH domain-containing protein [Paenibacillus]MED4604050.1 SPFH domain-containing protein [Paenibacillus validus]MED4608939.1 SPFH domain-containing protein [Paenibacillus validus]MUG71094.1 SPFH domain-containing protein [Paenibacillus validus]
MQEKKPWVINGFVGLLGLVAVDVIGTLLLIDKEWPALAIVLALFSIALLSSLTIVQPNQAMVVTFFGSYSGTIRRSGIWMTIPFSVRKKVSLRVRNFNSAKLKVNDIEGNPIEIAAVVVFRVVDSAKASFDVDNYEQFVEIQSETALRHVANKYPYDTFEDGGYSLRGNSDEVAAELARELQERLSVAGVEVMEARLTHLAYSTEIASAMLQRQQAAAIIAARSKIVEGAVGMVQLAISQLQREGVIELDEERKAAMINNLLVAIVSDRSANPVINTGSLY